MRSSTDWSWSWEAAHATGGLRLDVLLGVTAVALVDGGAYVLGAQHPGHGLG
ncbi:hypothetical protein [Streptomyces ortus]|uniref:Uncharacterized protein n=1 Tax=Streptomyces ortus TaxID=2867268 RepID=A0ABT3UW89_9ACTN|nr:hypothetical protein [Streptomyces ortus]MCX4231801.1 hypothetical protein [Streptomyces ortus]